MIPDQPTASATYKLRCPNQTEHAIYFTIVMTEFGLLDAMFINSKEIKVLETITALFTAYHNLAAAGRSTQHIINDMKEAFDPKGEYIIPDGSGRKVNGLIHHLGLILEQHVKG